MIPTPPPIGAPTVSRRTRLLDYLPAAVVVALTAALAVPFAAVPFPFIDLYSLLSVADATSWAAIIPQAFHAGVEYRPLLTLGSKLAYETIGLHLWLYKAIVLLQFAGILAVLVWMFRPRGGARSIAAAFALVCLTGLHSSRIVVNFNPLNAHSAVLLIVLLSAAWAMTPTARSRQYVFFLIALGATLLLESGLMLIPVLAALWLIRAPGITTRGVLAALLGIAVYAAIHLGLGARIEAVAYTHSGLGFSAATPERLDATFGRWLWLFWAYNVLATIFTVAFSEPREGTYEFVSSLLHGSVPAWMWLHVVSSAATTVVMVAAFPRRQLDARDRAVTAVGIALILGGSALGFLYTRDRIALPVGVGYSMLLYVALSSWLAKIPGPSVRRVGIVATTAAIAMMWLVRDAELYWFLRDLAWEHHREWTVRYESIRDNRPVTDLMLVLQALALEQMPVDPTTGPAWSNRLLERKFGSSSD